MRHGSLLVSLLLSAIGCSNPASSPSDGPSSQDAGLVLDAAPGSTDASRGADAAIAGDLGPLDLMSTDLASCSSGFVSNGGCPQSCSPLVESVTAEPAVHIPYPMKATWAHNPPSSGEHWGDPMYAPVPYGQYNEPVAREAWVHNLEHGGIVLAYNCPPPNSGPYVDGGVLDDCASAIAGFTTLMNNAPLLQWCCDVVSHDCVESTTACPSGDTMFSERKVVITPDPLLPTKLAIVAWGWDIVTDTFDYNTFNCFLQARYDHGPEAEP